MKIFEMEGYTPSPEEMANHELAYNIEDDKLSLKINTSTVIDILKPKDVEDTLVGLTSFRNRVINGCMRIEQRVLKPIASSNPKGYGRDRFYTTIYASGTDDIFWKQDYDTNKQFAGLGVWNPAGSLSNDYFWGGINYRFEGQQLFDIYEKGGSITITFWFKSSHSGTHSFSFNHKDEDSYVTTFNYNTADVPQKITQTISLSNAYTTTPVSDINLGFAIRIGALNNGVYSTNTLNTWQTGNFIGVPNSAEWGSVRDGYIQIAELQVEEGTIATTFEERPYGLELLLCQRYYYGLSVDKETKIQNNPACHAAATFGEWKPFPTTMRVIPTVASNITFSAIAGLTSIACEVISKSGYNYQMVSSQAISAGWYTWDAGSYVDFDAEF